MAKKEKMNQLDMIQANLERLSFIVDCYIKYTTNDRLFARFVDDSVEMIKQMKDEKNGKKS